MIGIHVSKDGKELDDALIETFDQKWETGQVFLWVPQQLKQVKYDSKKINKILQDNKTHIWVHSSYLISPWGNASYNMPLALKQLEEQAKISPNTGVVFHMPNRVPKDFIKDYAHLIKNKPKNSNVLLENKAFISSNTLAKPETYNLLVQTFIKYGIPKKEIQFCIDTAHLTSAGLKITTEAQAQAWIKELKYPETIKLFHLNGNSSTNTKDIHEIPGSKKDLTWSKDDSGLK
jgi:endonuclease IV